MRKVTNFTHGEYCRDFYYHRDGVFFSEMRKIIIVHGWAHGPHKDWLPWLRVKLEKKGYEVLVPDMPDPNLPIIEKWVGHLSDMMGTAGPDKDTYFIGHSVGCQTILRYLDVHHFGPLETVGGAVFVAGWFNLENLEDEETKTIAKPWLEIPINSAKIRTMLPKSTLIISDNDPYGAFEENKQKFSEIGSKIVVLHDAGHITFRDGFMELPQALSELENLQKEEFL